MSDQTNNNLENVLRDPNMDLSKLKETANEIMRKDVTATDGDPIGSDWMNRLGIPEQQSASIPAETNKPQLPNDGITVSNTNSDSSYYDGPGLIVNNNELNQSETVTPRIPGLASDVMANINDYMTEMDDSIAELKAKAEAEKTAKQKEDEEPDDDASEMTQEQFDQTYNEAVVIIDKTGMGSVINFTTEERDKLEKVKKIRLEEIETISLQTIKSKKIKKSDSLDTLIKRQTNLHSTSIVLVASGYTATIRGCSTYEVISLMRDSQNALMDYETKWTLIHSKIESTSIGKMTYNEFLHNTAAIDYNVFLYGLLCATYPDDDKIPLKCETCPTEFNHPYTIKSLIRVEKMTELMKIKVAQTIDASHSSEMAQRFHSNSPVSMTKAIRLPGSGVIADIYVQSAYDFINKSIKELSENKDNKYNQASVLSSVVNKMYIPDPDNENEYFEVDGAFEIAKVIYSLGDTDIIILTKQGDMTLDSLSFEFGLMNVECPNCKHKIQTLPMDLEAILFYKYQQAMSTKIE